MEIRDCARKTFEKLPYKMYVGYTLSNGKKIPVDIKAGRFARVNDPSTWCELEEVLTAFNRRYTDHRNGMRVDGIGVIMTKNLCGLDLDDCVICGLGDEPTGELTDYAQDIVNSTSSYWEYSISGRGIHILFLSDKPIKNQVITLAEGGKIEVFGQNKYLTFSGDISDECWKPIQERSEAVAKVLEKYSASCSGVRGTNYASGRTAYNRDNPLTGDEDVHTLLRRIARDGVKPHGDEIREALFMFDVPVDIADAVLCDTKPAARYDEGIQFKLLDLLNGNTSRYDSDQSRADLGLAKTLTRYTKNVAIIERIMRSCVLYRPKYDEDRKMADGDVGTYLLFTIRRALGNHYKK